MWYDRGPHGLGVMNETGRELLSFLSINGATVCNTWFKKNDVHKRNGSILYRSAGIVLIMQ